MKARSDNSKSGGYTLVEAVISSFLVMIMAGGLFAAAVTVMKMAHTNRVTLESRALGLQQLEEISAAGIQNIALQVPYAPMTNYLLHGEPVVRTVDVIGHGLDGAVVSNLAESAYMEVVVYMAFESPMSKRVETNVLSMLVR